MLPGRTVQGHGIPVPESRLNEPFCKHLPDYFEGIYRFLHSLGWKAIHKIGMHHDIVLGKVIGRLCRLLYGNTLIHEIQ